MGWERKRGKLHELNRLLRGATDTTFLADRRTSPPVVPAGVRYVITLDADTRLPRGAAKRLVGKMAHPLNASAVRRRIAAAWSRVTRVLQPRVTPSLPTGREGSVFQRVFSSASGIDPYAFAVSDVYQDLFGEGSYSGKGIYDVDIFEAALSARVPDNTLLSHDLLEGIFARAGLVSDIEVVEEFPSRYDVAAARQHRWARGDWQLLPWILGCGHGSSCDRGATAIPTADCDSADRPLENDRQSAPHAVGAGRLPCIDGGMDPRSRLPPGSGRASFSRRLRCRAMLPFLTGLVPRRLGISKRSHARAVGADLAARAVADRDARHAARASGVADDRRDRANALPSVRESSADARVGDCRAGQVDDAPRSSRVLPAGWPAASRSAPRPRSSSGSQDTEPV